MLRTSSGFMSLLTKLLKYGTHWAQVARKSTREMRSIAARGMPPYSIAEIQMPESTTTITYVGFLPARAFSARYSLYQAFDVLRLVALVVVSASDFVEFVERRPQLLCTIGTEGLAEQLAGRARFAASHVFHLLGEIGRKADGEGAASWGRSRHRSILQYKTL